MFTSRSNLSCCTFAHTGKSYQHQYWKRCLDCFPTTEEGACLNCIAVCHQGHNVEYQVRTGNFYCDCGMKGAPTCKIMTQSKVPDFPVRPHPEPYPEPDCWPHPNPFTDRPSRPSGFPPHQYEIPRPMRPGNPPPTSMGNLPAFFSPSSHQGPTSMGNLPAFYNGPPPPQGHGSSNGILHPKSLEGHADPFANWDQHNSAFKPQARNSGSPPSDHGFDNGPSGSF